MNQTYEEYEWLFSFGSIKETSQFISNPAPLHFRFSVPCFLNCKKKNAFINLYFGLDNDVMAFAVWRLAVQNYSERGLLFQNVTHPL